MIIKLPLFQAFLCLCCYRLAHIQAWVPVKLHYETNSLSKRTIGAHFRGPSSKHLKKHFTGKDEFKKKTNNKHLTTMSLSIDDSSEFMTSSTPLILVAALVLLVAAQSFINNLASGDQGLGAFLQDGSGYNKSGFKPNTQQANKSDDPLPWLTLPKLDFVEVAGQDSTLEEELERLRMKMNDRLQEGKIEEATALRDELQALMKASGFEYEADESS